MSAQALFWKHVLVMCATLVQAFVNVKLHSVKDKKRMQTELSRKIFVTLSQ